MSLFKENNNPKINPDRTQIENILQIIGAGLLVISFLLIILNWSSLPSKIPVTVNDLGEVTGSSSKLSLLLLPVIAFLVYFSLALRNRYPWRYRFNIKITKKNAKAAYTIVKQMAAGLAASVNFMLLVINIIFISRALDPKTAENPIYVILLILSLVLVVLTFGIYFYKIKRIDA